MLLSALTLQGGDQLQAVQMYWEAVCHEQCSRPLAVLAFLQAVNVHDTQYSMISQTVYQLKAVQIIGETT